MSYKSNFSVFAGSHPVVCRQLKFVLLTACFLVWGGQKAKAQFYAVHTDALGLATGTLNAGVSAAAGAKWSLHFPVQYNPWTLSDNKKLKQLTIQPGARFWLDQSYGYGWFIGMNAVVSRFNASGVLGSDYRYDGMAFGGAFTAGFSLPVTRFFNLEFEAGGGVAYTVHDKYECVRCSQKLQEESNVYLVPTRASVNLVYLF